MISSLVGFTGFVGSNLALKYNFTNLYNSRNIEESFGTNPDLLVYAGVRAEKYLANQYPEKDYEIVKEAFENIKKIHAKQVVLISSIDVYKNPVNVDEDSHIDMENLHPYGLNRYLLEQWVEKEFSKSLILRLPGLYGKNIKKNFIYDMINIIPKMLKKNKYEELANLDSAIKDYYTLQDNGFYKCIDLLKQQRDILKEYFIKIGFTALNFTDSRGVYQFYNLENLWEHMQIALNNNIQRLNLATEPVSANEISEYVKNQKFCNEIASDFPYYNYKTKYEKLFNGKNGYIHSKKEVLMDIKKFVEGYEI